MMQVRPSPFYLSLGACVCPYYLGPYLVTYVGPYSPYLGFISLSHPYLISHSLPTVTHQHQPGRDGVHERHVEQRAQHA